MVRRRSAVQICATAQMAGSEPFGKWTRFCETIFWERIRKTRISAPQEGSGEECGRADFGGMILINKLLADSIFHSRLFLVVLARRKFQIRLHIFLPHENDFPYRTYKSFARVS